MAINWYPGHMVKAKREIEENMKLVDIVAMLLDARAPFSCRNSDLEKICRRKQLLFVLNKIDLASPDATQYYLSRLRKEGEMVTSIDSTSGKGLTEVIQAIKAAYQPQVEEMLRKGRRIRPARVMVVGVPNIGKSTFLNCLVGKKMAQTGAKPGITRGKQWVRVREDIELMDTPGLMWPKVEAEEQGLKLALLNIVGENAYNEEEVAMYLLKTLQEKSPETLTEKLKVSSPDQSTEELLGEIALRRGHLLKAGALDTGKTCTSLLHDFRKGKLCRISLD
ncbi:MAG: ribosome biogenesis GTPase YlqF [Firmicutes bacterium HGW-Firmicutes-15]|nr:MAG: ribosome biogenesis GTPase YlqF [Firmicutes bacterium HGW-Firmicutes-15]